MTENSNFIVLEGVDGSGKSTHTKILAVFLKEKGLDVLHTKEPSKGDIGVLLREYLKKDGNALVDALLFTADRAEHVEKEIKPALDQGKTIICERYIYSTIAYQVAQGLDEKWIKDLNSFAPKPDYIILLDLTPEIAVQRATSGEKFETLEFLTKVRANYMKLAQEENFFIVDANRKREEVQKELQNILSKLY